MLYLWALEFHNFWRWAFLLALLLALLLAWRGIIIGARFGRLDFAALRAVVIAVDLQFLVGLLLFVWLSPVTRQFFVDFGGGIRNREVRFFAMEHSILMLAMLCCVHLGNVSVKRAATDLKKHRAAAIWFTLSLLLALLGTPWWRPLLRLPT